MQDQQEQAIAKGAFDLRQALRDSAKKAANDTATDPTATPDQRAAAKAQEDSIDAQGFQDQLDHAKELKLTLEQIIRLRADLTSAQGGAVHVVAGQQIKGQHAAEQAASKIVAEEIRQATAQIETSHNPEAIAEMRKFIAAAKGGIILFCPYN